MTRLLSLVGLLLAVPSSAAACGPPAARTVAQGDVARVYVQGRHTYACTRRSEPVRVLGVRARVARVRGRRAALLFEHRVFVVDARTGREDPGVALAVPGELERLELGPGGALAASARTAPIAYPGDGSYEHRIVGEPGAAVVRSFGCGEPVLAEGPDVDPASLRMGAGTLTWSAGGVAQTGAACPSTRRRRARCPAVPRGAEVVVLTPAALVVRRGHRVAACRDGRLRRVVRDDFDYEYASGLYAGGFTGDGDWVAWYQESCDRYYGCDSQGAFARNLVTGERRTASPAGVVGVRVSAGGRLVVADKGFTYGTYREPRVTSVGADGETVLSAGEDVDEGSLRVLGETAYWTVAGRPRSADLP